MTASAPQRASLRDEGRVHSSSQLFDMVDDGYDYDEPDRLQGLSRNTTDEPTRDRGRLSFYEIQHELRAMTDSTSMLAGRLDERNPQDRASRSEDHPAGLAASPSPVAFGRQTQSPPKAQPILPSKQVAPHLPGSAPRGRSTAPPATSTPVNLPVVSDENSPPAGMHTDAAQSNGTLPPKRRPQALDLTNHNTSTQPPPKPQLPFESDAQLDAYGRNLIRSFSAAFLVEGGPKARSPKRQKLTSSPAATTFSTPLATGLAQAAPQSMPSLPPPRRTIIIDLTRDDSGSESRPVADPPIELHRSESISPSARNGFHASVAVNPMPPAQSREKPKWGQSLRDVLSAFSLQKEQPRVPTPPPKLKIEPAVPRPEIEPAAPRTLSNAHRKRIILSAFHRYKLPTESQFTPSPQQQRNTQPANLQPIKFSLQQPPNASVQPPAEPFLTPNFDASCLPLHEHGAPHSAAEKLLLIYLFEEKQFHCRVVDKMLGRQYKNFGSGCYTKWNQGLRRPEIRAALGLDRNMTALAQIMTLDWPILATREALDAFLTSGVLPAGLKLPPNPAWTSSLGARPIASAQQPRAPTRIPPLVNARARQTVQPVPPPRSRLSDDQSELAKSTVPSPRLQPQPHILPSRRHSGFILGEDANDLRATESSRLTSEKTHSETPDRSRAATDHDDGYSMVEVYRGSKRESSLGARPLTFVAPPRGMTLPYLSHKELAVAQEALRYIEIPANMEKTARIHYPFSGRERDAVELAARRYRDAHVTAKDRRPPFKWLKQHWRQSPKDVQRKLILAVANEASDTAGLWNRTEASIHSFLVDLVHEHDTVMSARIVPTQGPDFTASLLSRSMGYSQPAQLRDQYYATLAPSLAFHDLSGEVNTLAFHPDGSTFAAGTICFTDRYNLEYNDSGSLAIGYVDDKRIVKTADHWRAQEGPLCSPAVTDRSWQTPGRELHYTVSSVGFSKAGILYSSGRDGKLLAYDTAERRVVGEYADEASGSPPVECMSVARDANVIAIGRRTAKDSVVILRHEGTAFTTSTLGLSKDDAELGNDMIISPATLSLGFGQSANLLVAGYSAHKRTDTGEDDPSTTGKGQMSLFDIETRTQLICRKGSVFATAWSPIHGRYFAAACAPTTQKDRSNKGVKSLVRVYSPSRKTESFSLDCFAHDINELTICPYDNNYVAAGSTDGRLYVWDLRNPNQLLHELRHGLPICETPLKYLNPPTPYKRDERWMWDTGIRFCTWNHSRTGFVTGSSDGVVKIWDIFRSTEDAHRADLVRLDSAVTAATYSQDYSRLIVGEVNKSITVLDVGHQGDDGVEEFVELHPRPLPAAAIDLDDEASNAQHAQAQTAQGARTTPPRRELGTRSVDEPTAANEALCRARIPANLRAFEPYVRPRRARALGLDLTRRPCLGCGASVPAALADEGGAGAWCQRCRFGCFRCGRFVRVPHPYDLVECRDCGLAWRVGAAGYDLVPRGGIDVEREAPRVRQAADDAWDGELADHYHALWGRG